MRGKEVTFRCDGGLLLLGWVLGSGGGSIPRGTGLLLGGGGGRTFTCVCFCGLRRFGVALRGTGLLGGGIFFCFCFCGLGCLLGGILGRGCFRGSKRERFYMSWCYWPVLLLLRCWRALLLCLAALLLRCSLRTRAS